ncbi:MAG: hypothetical protein QOD77_1836 [Thermoplasmata archaeon]|jgi:hypothetical protein|nr:hypothetical protein [Thermoplasmata archaeon]
MQLEVALLAVVAVGTAILVVAAAGLLFRMARRHADVVPAARAKAVGALVASLVLGGVGIVALHGFESAGHDGIHATFTQNLNKTVGESDYLEAQKARVSKTNAIDNILPAKILAAQDAVNATPEGTKQRTNAEGNLTALQAALVTAHADLAAAEATMKRLAGNHLLWLKVQPHLAKHTPEGDAEAHDLIERSLHASTVGGVLSIGPDGACARDAKTGDCTQPVTAAALEHDFKDSHQQPLTMEQGFEDAYHHKAEFTHQMESQMAWFFYPSLTGLFLAPFAFVGGHFLSRAFVPSDSVGFKKYPGTSAGFFLLLGGFGLPALPFSAWLLRDFAKRSAEGQIAL